jgi:hypothetical protein
MSTATEAHLTKVQGQLDEVRSALADACDRRSDAQHVTYCLLIAMEAALRAMAGLTQASEALASGQRAQRAREDYSNTYGSGWTA